MEVSKNELNAGGAGMSAMSRRSNIVNTLTANDIVFWGADSFILVSLALFVVTFIEGATVFHFGIALMIHRVVGALAAIPVGRLFDRNKGYLDEVWGLSLACLLAGFVYIWLSFSTTIWQLYLAMLLLGITSTVNLTSWRILFYGNIGKKQFGQTVGVYQTLFSLGIGIFLAIGGFAGERFGYEKVLMFGGFLMVFGSTFPLLIRGYFSK